MGFYGLGGLRSSAAGQGIGLWAWQAGSLRASVFSATVGLTHRRVSFFLRSCGVLDGAPETSFTTWQMKHILTWGTPYLEKNRESEFSYFQYIVHKRDPYTVLLIIKAPLHGISKGKRPDTLDPKP